MINRIKRSNFLNNVLTAENSFYMGFFLYMTSFWLSQAIEDLDRGPLMIAAAVFFVYKNIRTKFCRYELIVGVLIMIASLLVYVSSNCYSAAWIAVIVISMKDVSVKKTLRILLYISLIVSIVVMVMAIIGYSGDLFMVYFGRNDVEVRYHIGINHPNDLHFRYLFITALIFALYFEKLHYYHFALLIFFNAIFVKLTLSRTGSICCFTLIGLMMILKYFPRLIKNKINYIFIYILSAFCVITSIVLMIVYSESSNLCTKIDKIASGRLNLAAEAFHTYGISLFGKEVNDIIYDMGISRVLIEYGIVFFLLFYIGYALSIIYLVKKQKIVYLIIMVIFLIYSVSERINLFAYYNIQVIIMGYALWNMNIKRLLPFRQKHK